MTNITYRQIGIIHSPFTDPKGTPIQPLGSRGVEGSVEVYNEFEEGLKDIEGFSHLILLYHLHLAKEPSLLIKPFLDTVKHGVFSTRAPSRPNPIGLSVVRIIKKKENILYIQDVDMLDGTPLLDIKPYVPDFDARIVYRIGWLEGKMDNLGTTKDDGRFKKN